MSTCATCGSPLRTRSEPHHRLFFSIIARAFENWPEGERFQPADPEHLRSYLLIKAGHFEKLDLKCSNPDAISLEDQLRSIIKTVSGDKPSMMHSYEWGVRIFWPRSLSYAAADRKVFNEVSARVFEILETVLGVEIEALKRESELDAA